MGILAPLPEPQPEIEVGTDSPTVQCENPDCGRSGLSHLMINVMITIGSPGHPAIPGWQCPHIEHWACSLDCWRVVSHACLDEHMFQMLKVSHAVVGR
jgi:hypothetical protein